MTTDTIVIVGTGQAGGWAAQTLRKAGHAGRIVLIGDEPHQPCERPPLSKAVLSGDASAESTYLIKGEAFEQLALVVEALQRLCERTVAPDSAR